MKTNKIVTASAYRKGGLRSYATVSIRVGVLALGLLFGAISSLQARAPSPVEPIDTLPVPPPIDSFPAQAPPPAGPIDVSPEQNTDVSTRTKERNTMTGEYDRLLAHTYNTLQVDSEANDDGSFKRAIIEPRTIVEFAESAGRDTH